MTVYTNPGAVGNVVTLTTVESSWANAIRDRVINNFATTTARNSAIGAPVQGQTCYVAYTGAGTGLLTYAGATDTWQAPWNLPWGYIGQGTATSTQSGITTVTDLTGLTVSWTAIANRLYKVSGTLHLSNTTVGDGSMVTLANGGNGVLNTWEFISATANQLSCVTPVFVLAGLSAGANVAKFRLTNVTGGTSANSASATLISSIIVEDIGPNGNPS